MSTTVYTTIYYPFCLPSVPFRICPFSFDNHEPDPLLDDAFSGVAFQFLSISFGRVLNIGESGLDIEDVSGTVEHLLSEKNNKRYMRSRTIKLVHTYISNTCTCYCFDTEKPNTIAKPLYSYIFF